jgi:hypothetical protein
MGMGGLEVEVEVGMEGSSSSWGDGRDKWWDMGMSGNGVLNEVFGIAVSETSRDRDLAVRL